MNVYFFDTSALVKRYVNETGYSWIRTMVDPVTGNKLIVARITWVEILSAFARLRRENKLSLSDSDALIQTFRYDWNTQYQVAELNIPLAELAGELLNKYPLRAYDSVQLASALRLYPTFAQIARAVFTFISADERLINAAKSEGLLTGNPNEH